MNEVRFKRNQIHEVILPIFKTTNVKPYDLISFQGMGFIIAPNLFLTCWHCLDDPLENNEQYAAIAVKEDGSDHTLIQLSNIERDANGLDLATANHDYTPSEYVLKVGLNDAAFGQEIWTYGFPLTTPERSPDGKMIFNVPPQFLKGYIIRNLTYNQPGFGNTKSYELDMLVPKGLSGAPLMILGNSIVIGVIYSSNDVATIEHFSSINPATQVREPELQRIISFGLAHYTENLLLVRGKATENQPLIDYCKKRSTG